MDPTAPARPGLDPGVLDKLAAVAPGLPVKIIDLYLLCGGQGLAALQAALGAGLDLPAARAAAHGLKSSSANVGALAVAQLAREMEGLAHSGDGEAVRQLLPAMQAAMDAALDWLRAERLRRTAA